MVTLGSRKAVFRSTRDEHMGRLMCESRKHRVQ